MEKRDTNIELLIHEMQRLSGRLSELQEQQVTLSVEVYRVTTEVEKLQHRLEYLHSELKALKDS